MIGPGQAARHRPLLRHRRQQSRQLLRLDRPAVDQSRDRRAVGRRFPAGDRRGLGRCAGAARRSARHPAVRRGDGRQPRRHAGARLGDPLSRAHPPCAGDRGRAQPLGAEHRVQRGRAAGDPHRSRFPRRPLRRARREAAARPARRADDRPHHLSVRRADGGEIRPRAARRPPVLVRARVPDRVVPAPPGREVRRVLRRQHLPAHHQGARLFRSRRSRPAATSPARWRRRPAGSWWSRSPPTGASRRRARARS